MTPSPTHDEFMAATRAAFAFLETELDCVEQPVPKSRYENEYQVRFASTTTRIDIEGHSYGFAANVLVHRLSPDTGEPIDMVPLWAILKCRRASSYETCMEAEGQLGQVQAHADALRTDARHVLEGDFSDFRKAHRMVKRSV